VAQCVMCAQWKEMNRRKKRERRGKRDENEGELAWVAWVLGNSRRPPNELFSSLPIYFCSLFNQLPSLPASAVTRRPPPFVVSVSSENRTDRKSSFLDAATMNPGRWSNTARANEEERSGGYICHVFNKLSRISEITDYPDLRDIFQRMIEQIY